MIKIVIQTPDGPEIHNADNPVDAELIYFENCTRRYNSPSSIKIDGADIVSDAYYRLDADWNDFQTDISREQVSERHYQIWAAPVVRNGQAVTAEHASPTTHQIRAVLKMLKLSGSQAGKIFHVDSRHIRRWTGGESKIPFTSWRLLLHIAGLGNIR